MRLDTQHIICFSKAYPDTLNPGVDELLTTLESLAATNVEVVAHPERVGQVATAWLVLGGSALFLAGHALFIGVVWRVTPWSRVVAIILLASLGLHAPHFSALVLSIGAVAISVGVAVTDRLLPFDVDTNGPQREQTTEVIQS